MVPTQDHLKSSLISKPPSPSSVLGKKSYKKLFRALLAYRPQIDRTNHRYYHCSPESKTFAQSPVVPRKPKVLLLRDVGKRVLLKRMAIISKNSNQTSSAH